MLACFMLCVVLFNAVSFFLFTWVMGGNPELVRYRSLSEGRMTYVVAGNLGQADEAVAAIVDEIQGGVTFVKFRNTGYHANRFVGSVVLDMRDLPEGTKVNVMGISLGCQPAQDIARRTDAVFYAINPCMNADFLKPEWKTACYGTVIVGTPVKVALGWLSIVPVFNLAGNLPMHNYSVATLVEQLSEVAFYDAGPADVRARVVISDEDELLKREVIEEYFAGAELRIVQATHASINTYPDEYRVALADLGLFGE
jgi:hypothetical protein